MRIVWTHAAIRDLQQIRHYIARNDPPAASVAEQILKGVSRLITHPRIGRIGRLSGTRELVIVKTPYVVFYRVHGETLELLRVIHSRQQWPASGKPSNGARQRTRKTRR